MQYLSTLALTESAPYKSDLYQACSWKYGLSGTAGYSWNWIHSSALSRKSFPVYEVQRAFGPRYSVLILLKPCYMASVTNGWWRCMWQARGAYWHLEMSPRAMEMKDCTISYLQRQNNEANDEKKSVEQTSQRDSGCGGNCLESKSHQGTETPQLRAPRGQGLGWRAKRWYFTGTPRSWR